MKILIIEPYLTDSHRQWIDGFKVREDWEVEVLALPARHWKWRMHAAAITLAGQFSSLEYLPDLILASEMMDLALFKALITKSGGGNTPLLLYFHENQLCYPVSRHDEDIARHFDNHYAFINYSSALTADKIIFNSKYHQNVFLTALPDFLKSFPKSNTAEFVDSLSLKSTVIYPGLPYHAMNKDKASKKKTPIILWNHRWEYDKNPGLFFEALSELAAQGVDFRLVVLGRSFGTVPVEFQEAEQKLSKYIMHWGQVELTSDYYNWLRQCDIVVSTSLQDFFGISVVEAIQHHCWPILPDRLAFPEHIPKEYRSLCLYENDEELLPLLTKVIALQPQHSARMNKIVEHIGQYDVLQVNDQYVELFKEFREVPPERI